MERVKRCISGRHTAVEIRWHLVLLSAVFWGLVACARLGYPVENKYSITRDMLSALGSYEERYNPHWYWIFSIAMIYCGVVMLPILFYVWRKFSVVSRMGAAVGAFLMLLGSLGITLVGVFPYGSGEVIAGWEWRDCHLLATAFISGGFLSGIMWHGAFLIKDRFTRKTFAAYDVRYPYLKFVGPFLVCVPVLGTVACYIRWDAVLAAIQAAAKASFSDAAQNMGHAVHRLTGIPITEHLAIWGLTIFIVWFTALLSLHPALEQEREAE